MGEQEREGASVLLPSGRTDTGEVLRRLKSPYCRQCTEQCSYLLFHLCVFNINSCSFTGPSNALSRLTITLTLCWMPREVSWGLSWGCYWTNRVRCICWQLCLFPFFAGRRTYCLSFSQIHAHCPMWTQLLPKSSHSVASEHVPSFHTWLLLRALKSLLFAHVCSCVPLTKLLPIYIGFQIKKVVLGFSYLLRCSSFKAKVYPEIRETADEGMEILCSEMALMIQYKSQQNNILKIFVDDSN